MRVLLTAVLLVFPLQIAIAEEAEWLMKALKQDKPNALAHLVVVENDCPSNKTKVESIVQGIFIRSRIKPLGGDEWFRSDVFLRVQFSCIELDNKNHIFNLDVKFANFQTGTPITYDRSFGEFGFGDATYIEQALKTSVEEAVTAYLKANSDLGE